MNQLYTGPQLVILIKRIEDCIGKRNISIDHYLYNVLSKEDYQRVKQMLWDEYQHELTPIDTLRDTAYILQNKIAIA